MSIQAPVFEKKCNRVYIARVDVALLRSCGTGSYTARVSIRLDGRDGPFYRVDMMALSPWEAIDGGPSSAPCNLKGAKALAQKYLDAVAEHGTLTPKGF